MINTMLNEINKDYYDSVRKSILDYVLKDESERFRIGMSFFFFCHFFFSIFKLNFFRNYGNIRRSTRLW